MLLHMSEQIPPTVLGFERFEENEYTSIKRRRMIVQCKEEDVEKNGYPLTDRQTNMPHNDPAQYTVLGWVKIRTEEPLIRGMAGFLSVIYIYIYIYIWAKIV